uniref:Spondin-like TSP1 domain-containing protein n=1 Tax=Pelusios castaneus TaxID=367368 RepID=A0A8C8S7B2_9SAUR
MSPFTALLISFFSPSLSSFLFLFHTLLCSCSLHLSLFTLQVFFLSRFGLIGSDFIPLPSLHLTFSPAVSHSLNSFSIPSLPHPTFLSHFPAAMHCVVGPWGPWTECSSLCGVGSKDRTRQVTVPPQNGGTPCPDLKQRRGCIGENPVCDTAKEVAKILPDSFKRDFKDPWRRPHMLAKEKQPSYCVYFRLTQVGAACGLHFWSSQLMRERRVCVECQSDAVGGRGRCEGDGLEGARTFWTAISIAACQGSWIQESVHENCVCPPLSLIFV